MIEESVTEPGASLAARTEEYRKIRQDPERSLELVRRACLHHGVDLPAPRRYAEGSTIVWATGSGAVVKIFASYDGVHFDTERIVLERLAGQLPIRTPRLLAWSDLDGWPCIIMEELPGEPMKRVWEEIPATGRIGIMRELGEGLAALHALAPAEGRLPLDGWEEFMRGQRERCVQRQRGKGLAEEWLRQIPEFLERTDVAGDIPARESLLHTEIMRDHLLVFQEEGHWKIGGLVDFEPAMHGHPEYEFGSVGTYLTMGDAPLLRELLLAYGYRKEELGGELQRRFMLFTLLHRYSNLRWALDLMPPGDARTLDDLAARWWAF